MQAFLSKQVTLHGSWRFPDWPRPPRRCIRNQFFLRQEPDRVTPKIAANPFLDVLSGQRRAVPPIWMMRQAGRYLPEYRDVRARAGCFLDLCFTPELAAEVTLQPIRRFGFDAAIIFSDILVIPHALGQRVSFSEGDGPRLDGITDAAGLRKLRAPDQGRLEAIYETIRRVKQQLPDNVALLGFCGAPWTLATYMIAGSGSSDQIPARE